MLRNGIMAVLFSLVLGVCASASAEEVVVGTYAEFPPFEYVDGTGKVIGLDADLVKAIGREAGFTPTFSNQIFADLIDGLEQNRFHMVISGMAVTEARKQRVDFSTPYYSIALLMVSRQGDKVPESLAELRNMNVACLAGTTASAVLEEALGKDAKNVHAVARYDELFADLMAGKADTALVDGPTAMAFAGRMGGLNVGKKPMHVEQYAIAVKKGNAQLLQRVNAGMKKLQDSGEFDLIKRIWIAE